MNAIDAAIGCRFAVGPELTIRTAAAEHERLVDALATSDGVEIDLSQVAEIDGAGVQLLLAARGAAAGRDVALRFSGHGPAVLDVAALCGLDAQFTASPASNPT